MPPRTRNRAPKTLKENIGVKEKNKLKSSEKPPRKALADKTNSASDENLSLEVAKKAKKVVTEVLKTNLDNNARPRRERRLPNRFVENQLLSNLSNSKDSSIVDLNLTPKVITPFTTNINISKGDNDKHTLKSNQNSHTFKTPTKAESSLVANRPKRICRLPSRFDDHSISPSKYIPIKPTNASTPILQSKTKTVNEPVKRNENKTLKPVLNTQPRRAIKTTALQKKLSDESTEKSSPDSNNNAKGRPLRTKKTVKLQPSPKKSNPEVIKSTNFRNKNLSFKVLEDKKESQESDKNDIDVYEFTFDPNEEPKPQKKKRKVVKKKPSKPQTVIFKNNYNQNINKALAALKNVVSKNKPANPIQSTQVKENITTLTTQSVHNNLPSTSNVKHTEVNNVAIDTPNISSAINETKNSVHETNYPSIRVDDIAADIEPSIDHRDDINYSPVNSPRCKSPDPTKSSARAPHDPLNLQEDFSFFDDQPVASSSMNMSVRHPLASPWRVEFENLPIKWPINTYVKPNMTPAVESSFISSNDSNKKKHVYINMVPTSNENLPEIVNASNWKQTSIISFIKEVAERNAKKKSGKSVTPIKANSLFEDVTNTNSHFTPKKNNKKKSKETEKAGSENASNNSNDKENVIETRRETRKRKNDAAISDKPAKSPRQQDTDCTYFGFDDSENQDQENVSPVKVVDNRVRALRPRSRAVLQAINNQGPTRAVLPVAAKSKIATSSEAVNQVYEELKSAADAPVFLEQIAVGDNVTNIGEDLNDDSQSVHLFEDIEFLHHLKPTRKSYGKAKKVMFRQHSMSDSESPTGDNEKLDNSSEEDDLADLTFEVPNIKEKKVRKKKKKPKKLMSKKDEKEADAWAAGFNSMCEDIEAFPLHVE